ncbi:MAG TPA: GHKL domain-containing protein [Mobilitalea sp.]|nr:GHKL domain-containing protein [Mobilitalea sp.]
MFEYFQTYFIDMKYGPSFAFTQISFVVTTVLLLNHISFTLKGILKKLTEIVIWCAGALLFESIYYLLFGNTLMAFLPWGFILIAYALFASKYSVSTRILRGCLYGSSSVLILAISEALGVMRDKGEIGFLQGVDITSIFVVTGFILLILLLHRFSTESLLYVPNFCITLMVAISIFGCFSQFTYRRLLDYTEFNNEAYNTIICLSLWILELMAYYMCYTVAYEYSQNMDLIAMQHKAEIDKTVYKFSQQNYEEMCALRHEIKNHNAYMKSLLLNKEYDKLEEYFQEGLVEFSEFYKGVECGNLVINNILNYEITKAKAYGVTIDSQIVVPSKLPFRDTDVCSLLSNLLDNAIEACGSRKCYEPTVRINIRQDNSYLFIRVVNPIDDSIPDKERLSLKTTKLNQRAHGYGTKVINMITGRYNGYEKYMIQDNHFIADVMLMSVDKNQNMVKS